MTTTGKCNTCGREFQRSRPRQQKCDACFDGNRFICGGRGTGSIFTRRTREQVRKLGCSKPFTRQNGELLCPSCIVRLGAVPPDEKNYHAYLNAHGLFEARHISMGHGQHVGDSRIATFAVTANESPADTASMSDFWGPDEFDAWWNKLTGPERRDALQRFIDASPAGIEAATKINRGTIHKLQRRAAEFLNPAPDLVTAREFLGVTADEVLVDIAREIDNLLKMALPAKPTKTKTDAGSPPAHEWRIAA